ncbi:MAG: cytochrome c oxidase subunit 3, partial [Flavobacteriaceae bacterium]|nr:cytochrome c oxidase subunit 3 [Flavobacteriaceae bacterium]
MVLAVDAGHHLKQKKVAFYMLLTIIGGLVFVGSQAWEWKNFIKGEYGAVQTRGGEILQFLNTDGKRVALQDFALNQEGDRKTHTKSEGVWFMGETELPEFTVAEIEAGLKANPDILVRTEKLDENGHKTILSREESLRRISQDAVAVVRGANLTVNEYGTPLFADFFFFITGFHGFHVFSGVVFNFIIFINILLGTYEKRKNYEMVEKVGLYWHFVDLVWVFVFTFFYLV